MPDPKELEEEDDDADEEEESELTAEEIAAEAVDVAHNDAEVMLRMAVDLVSELVDKERVPQSLLTKLEEAHDELVESLPD